jgi:hypothetical protein
VFQSFSIDNFVQVIYSSDKIGGRMRCHASLKLKQFSRLSQNAYILLKTKFIVTKTIFLQYLLLHLFIFTCRLSFVLSQTFVPLTIDFKTLYKFMTHDLYF